MALFTKADLERVTIRKASDESSEMVLVKASKEFSKSKTYDIFISHSYSDADEILRLKQIIEEMNFTTYVDWVQDTQLNRSKVNKETADLLRQRMERCKSLFFVASTNSPDSRWMPWELGYFDGFKQRVAILPLLKTYVDPSMENFLETPGETPGITNEYKGQEYLGLYPYVSKNKTEESDKLTLWIHEDSNTYVTFNDWVRDKKPTRH